MTSKIYKFSREELVSIINKSVTISEVLLELGLSNKGSNHITLKRRCEKDGINLDELKKKSREYCNSKLSQNIPYSLDKVLVENSTYSRSHLKQRLIKDEILENICAICGHPPYWNKKPMSLVLDHINGVPNDNRLENLRLICPNCNSQTETFCGKHTRKKRK